MRVPRTNAAVSKVHTLFNCCILGKVYFQPLKGRGWKTHQVCFVQTWGLYVRVPRTNATVSKVETLFDCCILRKVKICLRYGMFQKRMDGRREKRLITSLLRRKPERFSAFWGRTGREKRRPSKWSPVSLRPIRFRCSRSSLCPPLRSFTVTMVLFKQPEFFFSLKVLY